MIKGTVKELEISNQIALDEFSSKWQSINEKIKFLITDLEITIFNLFSINDVTTTKLFIQHYLSLSETQNISFILNTRMDRPLRTEEFVEYISYNFPLSKVLLLGDGKYLAKKLFNHHNFSNKNLHIVNNKNIIQKIMNDFQKETLLFCIGNHKDTELLIAGFENLTNNYHGK